jgi:16S rRNA (guanine527-N7)-methyltransferase
MLEKFLSINGYKGKEKFDEYRNFLKFYNAEKCNLTSITEDSEIELKHFIDSLVSEKFIPLNATVLDIGSGAGFPGLPLKIVRDDIVLTMLDSVNKKVEFLKATIKKLDLDRASAVHSRIEDFSKDKKFDIVVSRAVAALSTLLEYALPFVKKDGLFIAYKSGTIEEEMSAAKNALLILGGEVISVEEIDLFESDIKRTLILVKKIKDTDKKYPRGKNLPRVKPL